MGILLLESAHFPFIGSRLNTSEIMFAFIGKQQAC